MTDNHEVIVQKYALIYENVWDDELRKLSQEYERKTPSRILKSTAISESNINSCTKHNLVMKPFKIILVKTSDNDPVTLFSRGIKTWNLSSYTR